MIHWGIIGAGTIAHRFAESLSQFNEATLLAVSNRTQEKAEQFKQTYNATFAYDDFQKVLDNPKIDMVYIALPHAYHYEWIKKAILAKKGILCEKPVVLTTQELKDILHLLNEHPVFFMEAMKSRFVPAYKQARAQIEAGTIGTLVEVRTSLRRNMPKETTTYHYDPIQGGCLLDMGIYNISLMEDVLSSQPEVKSIHFGLTDQKVETFVEATFQSKELTLFMEVGFDQYKEAHATFIGTKGTLLLPNFHRPTTFVLSLHNQPDQEYSYPYEIDDFHSEIQHAMDCFTQGDHESSIMPWKASLHCVEMIDRLKQEIKKPV